MNDDIKRAWFSKMIEQRGCFRIRSDGPVFVLSIRDDERKRLEEVQAYLGGVGNIGKPFISDKAGLHQPQSQLWIIGRECSAVIDALGELPLTSRKRPVYLIWRSAVQLFTSMPASVARNIRMRALQKELAAARAYAGAELARPDDGFQILLTENNNHVARIERASRGYRLFKKHYLRTPRPSECDSIVGVYKSVEACMKKARAIGLLRAA